MACETVCAAAVPVTGIVSAMRERAIEESGIGLAHALLAAVMASPAAMRATAWAAPYALHLSKDRAFQARGPRSLGSKRTTKAPKGVVGFFPGCAMEYFQPDAGAALVRVLEALGWRVIVPEGLRCCGRPLLSLGDRAGAEKIAAGNAAALAAAEADVLVTACASCGLTFQKEYPRLLRRSAVPEVIDIHAFLADNLDPGVFAGYPKTITWHDPCHLGRGQGLALAARDILRAIPGLTLTEMRDPDRCCGFGGVMRLAHHKLSDGIGRAKAETIIETKASVAVTGCPGCRMQIANSLKLAGSTVETLHTVQVLDQALVEKMINNRQ
jgi:Fe-S oxidoreductase